MPKYLNDPVYDFVYDTILCMVLCMPKYLNDSGLGEQYTVYSGGRFLELELPHITSDFTSPLTSYHL
jgi:hypothetical protein